MSPDEIKQIMKMLRAIANAQSSMRQDILGTKKELNEEINKVRKELGEKIDNNGNRIDMLGEQLNVLGDDAPTGEEFRLLEKRVTKVELRLTSV